jgi:hypothetical protein
MTEPSLRFERPLDPYETRALALHTTVLARLCQEGAPDNPLVSRRPLTQKFNNFKTSFWRRLSMARHATVMPHGAPFGMGLLISLRTAVRDRRARGCIADRIGQEP